MYGAQTDIYVWQVSNLIITTSLQAIVAESFESGAVITS